MLDQMTMADRKKFSDALVEVYDIVAGFNLFNSMNCRGLEEGFQAGPEGTVSTEDFRIGEAG